MAEKSAGIQNTPFIPVIICAFLSAFILKTGTFSLLSVFYLVPLGYAILTCKSLRFPFIVTAIVNIVAYFIFKRNNYSSYMLAEIIYLTVVFLCYGWIMNADRFPNIRTAYRFIIASAAGSVVFLVNFFAASASVEFKLALEQICEALSAVYASSPENDTVKNSFLQELLTPDKMLEAAKNILLRGGALAGIFFMFFINRQISISLFWLIKRQRIGKGLEEFFAPPNAVWVFSGSLATILLARVFNFETLEIIAWNVFVTCVIIFLAQGAGIFKFLLARRSYFVRMFANILVILVLFSPLNTAAVAALILLGIAENWLSLRQPKQGTASTPGL